MKPLIERLKKFHFLRRNVGRIILITSRWQYSGFLPLRFLGKVVTIPIFFLIRDYYYRFLISTQKVITSNTSDTPPRLLPQNIFLRAITKDKSLKVEEYSQFLKNYCFAGEVQHEWARRFMEVGRLDLARIGFIDLVNRRHNRLPQEVMLNVYRHLGAACFMLGKNNEANYYWKQGGLLRRSLFKPTTPRKYRILGPAWFVAIGHVAMLDYYIKHKKLYGNTNARIVAQWEIDQIPGQDLLARFSDLGITFLPPGSIQKDYNQWAKLNNEPVWKSLSITEKAAMVDDFWEYDFPNDIVGYAHAAARLQQEWEAQKHPPLFNLNNNEKIWIAAYLENLGVPKDAWYVCLHVREAGFHKQWNSLYPSMRDADISDYLDAINVIVKAGGWVLRMGDPSMKPLPPMKNVIDYAHCHIKTSTADILLAANARFFLGTNSGYATITSIYNVPCALTNWVPIGWPLWPTQDLMIPKLFKNKTTEKYLRIEEIFERDLAFIQNWSDLPADIELIENTPQEIADITIEMLSRCGLVDNININQDARQRAQKHYEEVAKRFSAFSGSRLAGTFIKKHSEVFSYSETESTVTTRGNENSWHTQSSDNTTVTLN